MTTLHEEQSKAAPGSLALVQALVNTQYGQGRRAHIELTSPEQLRAWLVAQRLLADGAPVTQGDFRRVLQLREALRSLLRANHETAMLASSIDVFDHLAATHRSRFACTPTDYPPSNRILPAWMERLPVSLGWCSPP